MDARAFVITGMQAAGKSTVARALARTFPRGVHVPGDAIRAMVVSGQEDMTPDASDEARRQLLLRYEASLAVAGSYLDAGFTVVVEDVVIGPILDEFLTRVPWPEFHLIVLNPDHAEIARREAGRAKIAYGPGWSVSTLGRVLAETPRRGLWLDSTGQTAEETVAAILRDLGASRVARAPGAG